MTRPVRWGVLGTGQIARRFAGDMRLSRTGRIAAVGSRSADKAARFAGAIGAQGSGDIETVLSRTDIDAVYVATPNATHADLALAALAAGKPVMVEKPLATSVAEAQAVADAAKAAGLLVMEAMWMRFTPGIVRLKRLIDEGAIGRIRHIEASLGFANALAAGDPRFDPAAGGALLDLGVYAASLAVHLAGPADAVTGVSRRYETGAVAAASLSTRHRDVLASLACSLDVEGPNQAVITGTDGILTAHRPLFCPPMLSLRRLAPGSAAGAAAPDAPLPRQRQPARLASLRQIASGLKVRRIPTLFEGTGLHYQADHVAECLDRGLTGSDVMPLADTIATLAILEGLGAG
ncbi:Gfo/Idh/MocA family protein [Jiella sp. M17.18]|uniref:Gfo/Idh/MocA family protein n=1 Tax=Jiella sp. M17.18 TaxID=3234247 RepID=UPI0034DEFC7B